MVAMKTRALLLAVTWVTSLISAGVYAQDLLPGQTVQRGRKGSYYPITSNNPPKGFSRALCSWSDGGHSEYCLAKVSGGQRPTISVWRPPARESGRVEIYVGDCLKSGCRFLAPDYDYPNDPAALTLSRQSDGGGQRYILNSRSGIRLKVYVPQQR